jgi:hypothetical protein
MQSSAKWQRQLEKNIRQPDYGSPITENSGLFSLLAKDVIDANISTMSFGDSDVPYENFVPGTLSDISFSKA